MVGAQPSTVKPLPYSIQWSSAGDISQVAQVVDGKWEITGGGVRIREPGYDRLIGIGSMDWDDYEVRTSFIVHGQLSENEGGIGILLGWIASAVIVAGAFMELQSEGRGSTTGTTPPTPF